MATGTITNDDVMPTLSVDSVSHLEGDSGTTLLRFTVSLSAPSGLPASADYATADSTATTTSMTTTYTAVGPTGRASRRRSQS